MAFGSQNNKRRRRQRSANARATPQPIRGSGETQFRIGSRELLASVAVVIIAMALILLVWINVSRAISIERSELRARMEATVGGQARVLADEIHRELIGVEQSLRLLKLAVQAHPVNFDIKAWSEQIPALTDVTNDVFVANERLIIQYDTNPASVGLGLGANIGRSSGVTTEQATHDEGLIVGSSTEQVESRQRLSYMLMRLDHPGGWLVGATYRTEALAQLFAAASLGFNGMTALVDTQLHRVQAISGPAAANPAYDIGNSAMFAAMRERPDGSWIGPSALDGVERIHGFRQVPGRTLSVVVAIDREQAMQPAEAWAENARVVAWGATIVILLGAAVVLQIIWTFRTTWRLRQIVDRERTQMAAAQIELADTRPRLESRTTLLQAIFDETEMGILVLDSQLRITEWNQHFVALFEIDPEVLQPGLPLEDMLRGQAISGVFGVVGDVEGDVARRVAQLRSSDSGDVLYAGAGGRVLACSARNLSDGGLIVLLREATGHAAIVAETAPAGS